jgi:hypothetical protein
VAKPFEPKVTSFKEASTNFRRVDKYMIKLDKFLKRFDWRTVKKKPRPGPTGSNPKPPSWPP